MARVEVLLPKMGESVAEATITTWLKAVGDTIESEESMVEIATDKVDSEIPAPADGIVTEILVNEGDVVNVGDVIAIISTEGEATAPTPVAVSQTVVIPAPTQLATSPVVPVNTVVANDDRFYSPLVKNIAQEEGIDANELAAINGTGQNGRVTKKDILGYLPNRNTAVATSAVAAAPIVANSAPKKETIAVQKTVSTYGDNVEIIEMDRMRKLIAEHMVKSKQTSPHVTSYVEADVTNIVMWRNKVKNAFLEREGEKITFTPIFIQAIVKALKDFPLINVSVDGDKIIRKKDLNIGMAAALPTGNLIVPVIKNADSLNLVGLTKSVNDLANRARNNKLKPDEIQGGTFTITNVGTFGNVMGTPIINQPQAAIMAVGAIRKKPAVIETPMGDALGIRHMMFLSLAYDHRVIDGALGGSFLRKVGDYLEAFDVNQEY